MGEILIPILRVHPREQGEEALPAARHLDHPVRAVATKKERLREDRQRRADDEEDRHRHRARLQSGQPSERVMIPLRGAPHFVGALATDE